MDKITQLIRHGLYTQGHKDRIAHQINILKVDEDNEFEVSIKPYKPNKTREQLGYYFAVIVPATMEFQGLVSDNADMWLREMIIQPKFVDIMGITYEVRKTISKMKVKEMAKYIDSCIDFLALHDVTVEPPRYTGRG